MMLSDYSGKEAVKIFKTGLHHVLELAGYKLVNQNGGKMFNTYYFA